MKPPQITSHLVAQVTQGDKLEQNAPAISTKAHPEQGIEMTADI